MTFRGLIIELSFIKREATLTLYIYACIYGRWLHVFSDKCSLQASYLCTGWKEALSTALVSSTKLCYGYFLFLWVLNIIVLLIEITRWTLKEKMWLCILENSGRQGSCLNNSRVVVALPLSTDLGCPLKQGSCRHSGLGIKVKRCKNPSWVSRSSLEAQVSICQGRRLCCGLPLRRFKFEQLRYFPILIRGANGISSREPLKVVTPCGEYASKFCAKKTSGFDIIWGLPFLAMALWMWCFEISNLMIFDYSSSST